MAVMAFSSDRIDSICAELDRQDRPGAAVGIAIDGRPVYARGFGLASMDLPVGLTPTTRMRIYSTTKHFTCLAYLLLCEEGRAALDAPIGEYLPELHAVNRRPTMRQLMTNTSGLRDVCDIRWQFCGTQREVPSPALLSLYEKIDDVNFSPGTAWSYNNGGFRLVTAAIERITGQALADVLSERVFGPVGMRNTLLRGLDSDFVPHSASMHMTTPEGFRRSYLAGALSGDGGIVSTVDDMLIWLAHMGAPRVGSAETWALIKSPHRLLSGASTGYGLGLYVERCRGLEIVHHPGGGMGANSQMLNVPAAGLDVVVLANRHDVLSTTLAERILDACLPDLEPRRRAPSRAFVNGTFRSAATGRVVQLRTADRDIVPWIAAGQQIASIDGADIALVFDTEGVLKPAGVFAQPRYALQPVGGPSNPAAVYFEDCGLVDELQPLVREDVPDARVPTGRYHSPSIATEARITLERSGPRLTTTGPFGFAEFSLERLGKRVWRAISADPMPWGGILSFEDGARSFQFSSLRTRALRFEASA